VNSEISLKYWNCSWLFLPSKNDFLGQILLHTLIYGRTGTDSLVSEVAGQELY
jgi:hypothetical protein